MIIYYFGSDSPWGKDCESNIRRRNMAILWALSQDTKVSRVYNIVRSTRSAVLKRPKQNDDDDVKIKNIVIAPIVPERGILKYVGRPLNRLMLKKIYSKALSIDKSKKHLAWCYWPKGYEDYEFLGLKVDMVFDTDHNIIDEPNSLPIDKSNKERLLLKAGKVAKYVISSSRSMLDWYQTKGFTNTSLMMNGVSEKRINLNVINNEKTGYVVTYSGTLSNWIKTNWLFKVIKDHPNWSFNFIGANYKTDICSQLERFKNVKMHGFLEPEDVDSIIKESNVCVGLYQKDDALDVNSMKLYDYLAQGIPVVVNNYHPYLEQDFNGLLNIASSYEDFINLMEYPVPMDPIVLEQFLNNSTWKRRVKEQLEHINI